MIDAITLEYQFTTAAHAILPAVIGLPWAFRYTVRCESIFDTPIIWYATTLREAGFFSGRRHDTAA